jgi:hypothetical protein
MLFTAHCQHLYTIAVKQKHTTGHDFNSADATEVFPICFVLPDGVVSLRLSERGSSNAVRIEASRSNVE